MVDTYALSVDRSPALPRSSLFVFVCPPARRAGKSVAVVSDAGTPVREIFFLEESVGASELLG